MLLNIVVLLIGIVIVTTGFLLRFKILRIRQLEDNNEEMIARIGGMVLIVIGAIVLISPILLRGGT
ncbi:hypothetical protein [Pontibacillus yanchengensis]|uniref:Uncharacterized protein n=1 Tax=Pontibacillus yanchengensis Y32 TaxID=1385514 RepID=A0A0A2TU22_9BACI|nr:hypothetical protein [Pontibacillus yanchengensis]KGP72755.1 hypothetical protein N782_10825 [Pontibacillus yanchengensis Y32]